MRQIEELICLDALIDFGKIKVTVDLPVKTDWTLLPRRLTLTGLLRPGSSSGRRGPVPRASGPREAAVCGVQLQSV